MFRRFITSKTFQNVHINRLIKNNAHSFNRFRYISYSSILGGAICALYSDNTINEYNNEKKLTNMLFTKLHEIYKHRLNNDLDQKTIWKLIDMSQEFPEFALLKIEIQSSYSKDDTNIDNQLNEDIEHKK